MDLRRLGYFVAVAEERHLGRAAARLHLSQPPLTRQIKVLENEVGALLFERTARGMVLTHAGEILLKDARSILGLVEQAADRANRAGSGRFGRIDVGVYGSSIYGVVPHILARFSRDNPDVEVSLYHAQTPQQVAALRQGRVLVAFDRLLPDEEDLAVELVASEAIFVAMSEGHALAGRDTIPVAALQGQTLAAGSSPSVAAALARLCAAEGFEPRVAAQTSDVVMATLLTAFSDHLTLVPSSMLNVRIPGVRYLPLETAGGDAAMELHCFYRRDERSPVLQRMLASVRAYRSATVNRPAGS